MPRGTFYKQKSFREANKGNTNDKLTDGKFRPKGVDYINPDHATFFLVKVAYSA